MLNKGEIKYCQRQVIASICERLSNDMGITVSEALNRILKSRTYELLMDNELKLYLCSDEAVYYVLYNELVNNNIEVGMRVV